MGGSAIEASKIAGHTDVDTTAEYTFVGIKRQAELTRRIQERLKKAAKQQKQAAGKPITPPPEPPKPTPPPLDKMRAASSLVQ